MPRKQRLPSGPERAELHYDRTQFEFSPHAMETAYIASIDGLKITAGASAGASRIDDSPLDWDYLRRQIASHGGLPPSDRLAAASARGEAWASRATATNVLALPRKLALAFIWRYWGGLTFDKIASTLGYRSRRGAFEACRSAERTLALKTDEKG